MHSPYIIVFNAHDFTKIIILFIEEERVGNNFPKVTRQARLLGTVTLAGFTLIISWHNGYRVLHALAF